MTSADDKLDGLDELGELVLEDLRIARPNLRIEIQRLAFRRGELTVLLGESGVGKSTIGRAIAGARVPGANVSGTRRLGAVARDLSRPAPAGERMARAREVALADQFGGRHLDPIARVLPELRDTFARFGAAAPENEARALLQRLGLDPTTVGARQPLSLSEGMAQRVNLALAIAQRAALTVFDEPLGPLDEEHAHQVLEAMLATLETGAALWITHRARLVQSLAPEVPTDVYVLRGSPTVEVLGPVKPAALPELLEPRSWRLA